MTQTMIEARHYRIDEVAFCKYEALLARDPRRCRWLLEGLIASPAALDVYERAIALDSEGGDSGPGAGVEAYLPEAIIDQVVCSGLAGVPDDAIRLLIRHPEALAHLQMEVLDRATRGSYWAWAIGERPYPVTVSARGEVAPPAGRPATGPGARPPDPFDRSLKLIEGEAIQKYVEYHACEIAETYRERPLLLAAVATGACFFATVLSRALGRIGRPHRFEMIVARSYEGTRPGELTMDRDQFDRIGFAGSHALLVDDIWDTGRTVSAIVEQILMRRPRSLRTSTLLRKRHGRAEPAPATVPRPDFVGFTIPDAFVVGYGLDHNGEYRYLPDVWMLPAGAADPGADLEAAAPDAAESGRGPEGSRRPADPPDAIAGTGPGAAAGGRTARTPDIAECALA